MNGKYSEEILKILRESKGLEVNNESEYELLNSMTPYDILDTMLNFEGIIGYTNKIKDWIEDIYDIKLLSEPIKPYYFKLKIHHHRTDKTLGFKTGIVFAENKEQAENIALEKYGSTITSSLYVEEIPKDGFEYIIYKSSMN